MYVHKHNTDALHMCTHTQLMEAYRSLQKENQSLKTTSAEIEKKAQRKEAERKEIQNLDQQAKAHLEESFRVMLEEKEEKIQVMQTQVGKTVNTIFSYYFFCACSLSCVKRLVCSPSYLNLYWLG